jgi:hypothetical protein
MNVEARHYRGVSLVRLAYCQELGHSLAQSLGAIVATVKVAYAMVKRSTRAPMKYRSA